MSIGSCRASRVVILGVAAAAAVRIISTEKAQERKEMQTNNARDPTASSEILSLAIHRFHLLYPLALTIIKSAL